jgi:hypothetical protein
MPRESRRNSSLSFIVAVIVILILAVAFAARAQQTPPPPSSGADCLRFWWGSGLDCRGRRFEWRRQAGLGSRELVKLFATHTKRR